MRKDDLVYVPHMLDAASESLTLAEGVTCFEFDSDRRLALALTLLLQTIGEAAKQTSTEFRAQHPGIPWLAIVGMRHRIVHDYLHVNFDVVWAVVNRDLSPLAAYLKSVAPPDS